MSGYRGVANTILNVLELYPTGNPFSPTEQPSSTTKYEYWDLGGGASMVSLANPAGGLKLQVKFSP